MIRVVLVDDHTSYRTALAFMLAHEGDLEVIGQAGTLAEARSVLTATPGDVALVDLELPDGSGLDLLPPLRAEIPKPAVVVLTGGERPESPALAIAAGALGFLHKSVSTPEIVAAIRRVAAGEMLFAPTEAIALLRQAAQYQARTDAVQRALDQLTPRERDVLRALATGLDNRMIATSLYLSTSTVHTHVASILHKLGVDSRLQAALLAIRYGVVAPDELD